ncbi:MAG: 4-hydroxy-3-methylbut-2-enyl diphosphate reductase [Candidatus Omnitrophica bacterium]|nr:4-hydroxy-3-methylbut-2-enyl diphosphate reductase [Candidatus Omnitrophota bacterium]
MIKIKKAELIGFCFGVKRAINIAENALKKKKKLYSLGPVIHNPQVVNDLSKKGIRVISDIKDASGGTILIRSHGVGPAIIKELKRCKASAIDATCPFVARSHKIVKALKKEGFYIIIIGEETHPEVKALAQACGADKKIVIDVKKIKGLMLENKKVGIVAQSTLTRGLFNKITAAILEKNPRELRIFDTLCKDVAKRQREAVRLSRTCGIMIVIGGKSSANTKRLAHLCREQGAKTYHVETECDIKRQWFKNCGSAGIITGSSTPDYIADRITRYIKTISKGIYKRR